MSWAQRLLGLETGETAGEVRQALAAAYANVLKEAQLLADDAVLAPTKPIEDQLRTLAAEDAALAAALEERLQTLGVAHPAAAPEPRRPDGALNHWARMVRALDRHRTHRHQLLELAGQAGEATDLGLFLDRFVRIEDRHLGLIRDLIARADPQALN